jgi:hypothetical protein
MGNIVTKYRPQIKYIQDLSWYLVPVPLYFIFKSVTSCVLRREHSVVKDEAKRITGKIKLCLKKKRSTSKSHLCTNRPCPAL